MGNFVNEFLEQVSRIQDVSERLMKFDDFITRLEDEFTKIHAFKRQLPLCMLLLNHAIMAVKEERMQCRKLNCELVLEEFIPLTKTCDQDNDGTKESTDTKEKMNWLRTSDLHQPIQDDEPHPSVLNDPIKPRLIRSMGIELLPFKGYSGLPFLEARKEEEDSPRLSLRTPGMENITDDIHVSAMSRGCSSSFSIARSSVGGVSQLQQQGTRKQRRCWSPDLHRRFIEALQQLGGSQVATPKQIRELMQVDGLTNDEVKSHLQKYRLHARRAPAVPGTVPNQSVGSGDFWSSSHDQFGETLKLSKSHSDSPPGPLHFGGTSQGTSTTGCDDVHDEGEENSLKYHAHSSQTSNAQPEREIRVVQENIVLHQDNNNNYNNNNKKKKIQKKNKKKDNCLNSRTGGEFKFNAHAPEFVPRPTPAPTAVPVSGYFVPCFQYGGGNGGADQWIFVSNQDAVPLVANANVVIPASQSPKNNVVLTEQLRNKIIKQVEYQFSDMSLLANENLVKQIQKDPEGFVPIAVVSSTKKLKSINTSNHNLLAEALRASTKLHVSSDGERVKRINPFTEKEKEELQSRTVVAENLPDDHSHQNLEKIFNVAGVVKTIRVCHPQEGSSRGKGDCVVSTKLHALVEFENVESAEKAVEKLNDERNWGKTLRVRLLLRRSPKSVLKNRKSAFDGYLDEEEGHQVEGVAEKQNTTKPSPVDNNAEDSANSSKKVMWSKGRGKPQQQRSSTYNGRGVLPVNIEATAKPSIKGPRMPDGTKGFNMGRGRPISIPV